MKIFLVLSNFPYDKGEAIEVVSHEVIQLIAEAGHILDVQVLLRDGRTSVNGERGETARTALGTFNGVKLLDPIYLNELAPERGSFAYTIETFITLVECLLGLRYGINPRLFPGKRAFPKVRDAVEKSSPNIILTVWSWESLAATYGIRGVPKFMYYGNPDHKPTEARLSHPELFDIQKNTFIDWIKYKYVLHCNTLREIQHLAMMRACEVTANNSLVDAAYYRNQGHPKSIYLQNMWPESTNSAAGTSEGAGSGQIKIVGSVGNLGSTGNTFALYYIGQKIAPGLETKLAKDSFYIDIYGGGRPYPAVAEALRHPSIRLRGWVDDLNSEINSSIAFLVLTNVDGFIVGNTRILLAWSLGACVIAHRNSALSMPEIKHMDNALLGETADEINDLICLAATDASLRKRIGNGGYSTFQRFYRSDVVVPKMLDEMRRCVAEK